MMMMMMMIWINLNQRRPRVPKKLWGNPDRPTNIA
jgi:hypothetical protein